MDGDIVFLFTDASYERPLNFEVLTEDPSFEHNGKFEYLALKILGIRPFSGSLTAFPIAETVTLQELHLYGSSRLGIKTPNVQTSKRTMKSAYTNSYGNTLYLNMLDSRDIPVTNPTAGPYFDHEKGLKQYELANHLSNVLVVFEDKKISHEGTSGVVGNYTASLLSVQDYCPFGAPVPGRSFNGSDYRYGMNTQEKVDEISGAGNHYTAQFWEYDPRIGKRWDTDPVVKPWESPYATFNNNPISRVDPQGNDARDVEMPDNSNAKSSTRADSKPSGLASTNVKKNDDGSFTVVGAFDDGDNNIYVVDGYGNRTNEVIGQTMNPWDFMETDDRTGEFTTHMPVSFDLNNMRDGNSLVNFHANRWPIAVATYNLYGGATASNLILALASRNGGVYDLKAHYPDEDGGIYTPFMYDGKVTTVRTLGNLLFGMNMRAINKYSVDQLTVPPYRHYIGSMQVVGAYNQKQNNGNGYNSGFPFYGEHTYSGTSIFRGYFGFDYKKKD